MIEKELLSVGNKWLTKVILTINDYNYSLVISVLSSLCLSFNTTSMPTASQFTELNLMINHVKEVLYTNISARSMVIENSKNISILFSDIHKSDYFGISIINSSDVRFLNDSIYDNSYDGINVQNSTDVIILCDNISFNGHDGITVWEGSQNLSISHNVLNGIQYGVFLLCSNDVNIT